MKTAKDISLTKEEKYAAREQVMAFMKKHPGNVRVAPEVRLHTWRLRNFFIFLNPQSMKKIPLTTAVLVVSLTLGVGAAAAAESALPGDLLYPVKIHVNEEVRGWLAVSNKAQAELDAKLAARRLEEAEELALENKLDESAQAELSARFEAHVNNANKLIQAVKADGDNDEATEIESELSSSLEAHGQVMGEIKLRPHVNESGRALINSLSLKVHSQSANRDDNGDDDDGDDNRNAPPPTPAQNVDLEAQAKASLDYSLKALAQIRQDLATTPSMFDAATSAQVEAQLKAAEQALVQGRTHLEAKQYAAANAQFETASRKVLQADKFIEAMLKLKLDTSEDKNDKDDDGVEIPPNYRGPDDNEDRGEQPDRPENRGQSEQGERPEVRVESRGGIDLDL